jgi:hypothetical protein
MSRWFDDLVVVRNRKPGEQGTLGNESQPLQPLRLVRPLRPVQLKVEATAILRFGESTADSCRFRVLVDGVAVTGQGGQEAGADWFECSRWKTGCAKPIPAGSSNCHRGVLFRIRTALKTCHSIRASSTP